MLIKAVSTLSTISCYNLSQSFPELFYCPINQILADLSRTKYQNFLQMFHFANLTSRCKAPD